MAHDDHLRWSLDYGTGTLVVAVQWVAKNQTIDNAVIEYLELRDHHSVETEQKAIWVDRDDGREDVVYGREMVSTFLKRNPGTDHSVLELVKLALHKDFLDTSAVAQVYKILGGNPGDEGSVQQYLTCHLRRIHQDARRAYSQILRAYNDPVRLTRFDSMPDSLPSEWYITSPALASTRANGILENAACAAGLADRANIHVVQEPLCVAAAAIDSLARTGRRTMLNVSLPVSPANKLILTRPSQSGKTSFIVLDVGRGTSDVATVKYSGSCEVEDRMRLRLIGLADGNDGGSNTLNELAWDYVKNCEEVRQHSGLEETCKRLNLDEYVFYQKISAQVEDIKHQFNTKVSQYYDIIVHGYRQNEDPRWLPQLHIVLERDTVEDWYQTWLEKNTDLLRRHIEAHIEREPWETNHAPRAIVTGGGAKSTQLKSGIARFLEDAFDIAVLPLPEMVHPCPTGALRQYYFEEDTLPEFANFYLAQDEPWDPNIHTDAISWINEAGGNTPVPSPNTLVFRNEYDNDMIVKHRLTCILKYLDGHDETNPTAGFYDPSPVATEFLIDANKKPRLRLNILRSDSLFVDHEASTDKQGNLRPGLHEYPIAFANLPDLEGESAKVKFEPVITQGKKHFKVLGIVTLEGTHDSLKVAVKLMRPGYILRPNMKCNKDGTIAYWNRLDREAVAIEQVHVIWQKKRSHAAENGTSLRRSKRKRD